MKSIANIKFSNFLTLEKFILFLFIDKGIHFLTNLSAGLDNQTVLPPATLHSLARRTGTFLVLKSAAYPWWC